MSEAAADMPREGWSRNKFLFLLALALLLHVALIIIFGTKKPVQPEPHPQGIPHLQVAGGENEFIALDDPTLFARPNPHDLVSAFWRRVPAVAQPDFNWTETPRYLPPESRQLGFLLRTFFRTNAAPAFALDLKPAPKTILPAVTEAPMPPATTLQISGDLARRRLLSEVKPPSLQLNDVIAPSKVRVLVDPAGNVASAVLLPLDSELAEKGRSSKADAMALGIARSLRFAPAPGLAFGEIIFSWHTVPLTTTNAP